VAQGNDTLLKFLSSNKFENPRDVSVMDEMVRFVIYNVALFVGASFLIIFGITVMLEGNTVRGILDLMIGFSCVVVIFLLRTKVPFSVCGFIPLAPFGVLCAMLVLGGGERGFAGLWVYAYPLLVIFILGINIGSILSGLLLVALLVGTLIPGLAGFSYTAAIAFRYVAVYFLVLVLTIVYEQIRVLKDQWVRKLTTELQTERDEITAMKDNLEVGMFMLNKDYIIQAAYSKSLETILVLDDIQGKKFTDLLSASVKAKERDTLEDYFNM
jgi:hypothetical protein